MQLAQETQWTSHYRISDTMRFQALFFLLLLACMYLSLAQGSFENCCLKHVAGLKKNMKRNVVSYRKQETDGGCNIKAIVFIMKKGKTACANPSEVWVQNLMDTVDKMKNTTAS
ncbi:C-C motif chemokine 25b isoform X1 [Esox lucius]|uniref:Chemokine (C-C motif) ligand 25b n=1 Tax=Esox lucius TaxID=8010 RepID=A0A3P8Z279_ESOLU|nr:C-C motif chemokine 25b isoform X1 [Esox lucius]